MILGVSFFFFFFRRLLVLPFLILRLVACSLVFLRGRSGPVALFILFFSLTCFAWFDHTAKQEKASLSKKKKILSLLSISILKTALVYILSAQINFSLCLFLLFVCYCCFLSSLRQFCIEFFFFLLNTFIFASLFHFRVVTS